MFKNISKFINSHSIGQLFNLDGKNVAWKKVRELKPGTRIAIAENKNIEWDEIVSVRKVGAERVYDIEVEGTHNFVGNGIVAHNTTGLLMRAGASSLQLSSSATSTTADIQLAAADRIDLFAGSLSLQTSSTSAGDLKIISKGSLILDTSSSLGGSAPIILQGGNVGIGTTSPGGILDVLGAGAGVLLRAGAASLQLSSSAASTTADIELAAADQMDLFAGRFSLTTSSSTAGDLKLISTGTLSLSTSSNNTGINVMTGTGALTETIGSLSTTASAGSLNAILLRASSGGIQLSTGSVGLGSLRLLSSGSLTLETSERNTNIALLPGTGGVALGVSTPAGSATLDLSTTSKGFLPPRMTTTQRDNISSPTKGLMIMNDTTNQLNIYNGSSWAAVGDGPSGVCNSSYDCRITLAAEYPGAIISADGSNNVGTITSDLTISASNYYYNYYEFSSGQASQQDYDVYLRWQLPLGWADWDDSANAIEIDLATESSTSTDSQVDATIYREADADSYSETANVSPTGGEWRTIQESKSVLSITKTNLNTIATWAAGDIMVIKLKLYSKDNYYSRIGNIRITYENQ